MAEKGISQQQTSDKSGNQIVPFTFEQTEVRVLDHDGEPWFVARDVATVLGYSNTQDAVRRHCKAAQRVGGAGSAHPSGAGLDPQMVIIPERDLYRLIMRSQLPTAEQFEEWIVGEVLPSIRKTGGYHTPAPLPVPQSLPEALRLAADLAEKNEAQQRQLEEQRPSVEALDRIASTDNSFCITDAAKALQIAPRKLFKHMRMSGWMYNRPGVKGDIAYQDKITAGLLEHKVHVATKADGDEVVINQVRVTPKGITRLAKQLKE